MRASPFYRITVLSFNNVILAFGKRKLNLWCPVGGGYVREVSDRKPGILGQQISADLAGSGEMMLIEKHQNLADVVRAACRSKAGRENLEYRAAL